MRKREKNVVIQDLIHNLKKTASEQEAPIWKDLATRLEKPRRNWAEVNISHLERIGSDGDVFVIPGKVLGSGELTIKVTVASISISESAEESIKGSGGKVMDLEALVKKNPTGSGVRLVR